MYKYMSLVKRNCLVFLRDRASVFYSLMSMLIVLTLMGIFLGNMNVESITELLNQYGGVRDTALDKENAFQLVQYWTLAGILVVNSVTVTLTVIGVMVDDVNENRLESFYCAPAGKNIIALSYITAAAVIGIVFCTLTFGAALVYIYVSGGTLLSVNAILQVILYTMVNVCIFSVIMYLAALFVKSSGAWSGVATIVGTLVGFIGAIYLPMGSLPNGVKDVLKYIPVLHGTSLMRKICCEEAVNTAFKNTSDGLISGYREYMGIDIVMNNKVVGSGCQLLFILLCGIIGLIAIAVIMKNKKISDR